MTAKKTTPRVMAHDPLADIDDLPSAADEILGEDYLLAGLTSLDSGEVRAVEPECETEADVLPDLQPEPEPEPELQAEVDDGFNAAADSVIDLGEVLTIREVTEVHERLMQAMIGHGSSDYVISAAALQQVDGAGLQLLAAFVREAARRGNGLCWADTSEALTTAAAGMGLSNALRLA